MPEAVRLQPATDPSKVLAVFLRDPAVHPYGIADVEQLWDRSHWWRSGDAVVGLLELPPFTQSCELAKHAAEHRHGRAAALRQLHEAPPPPRHRDDHDAA